MAELSIEMIIGLVVVVLAGALSLIRNMVEIWDRLRTKPPAHELYTTHGDLQRVESATEKSIARVETKVDNVDKMMRQQATTDAQSRSRMHERMNAILEAVANLKGKMEAQTS